MSRLGNSLLIFLILVTCIQQVNAQKVTVEEARDQYFAMDKSGEGALKLYKSLENADLSKNPLMLAYRGASSAAAAGSANGVRKKLEFFNKGKAELDKAAGVKPLDAEIRFLRLATQVNAPAFLGYTSDIKSDKTLIINTLTSVPANHPNAYLYQRICSFMLTYADLEATEKTTVNQLLVKFKSK
jgi:hypothetical protein